MMDQDCSKTLVVEDHFDLKQGQKIGLGMEEECSQVVGVGNFQHENTYCLGRNLDAASKGSTRGSL